MYCTYCKVQRKLPFPQTQQEGQMAVCGAISMRKLMLASRLTVTQVPLIHFKVHDSILALLTSSTLNFPSAGASSTPSSSVSIHPCYFSYTISVHPPLTSPLTLSLLFRLHFLCSRLFQKSLWLFSLCRIKPSP